VVYYVLGIEAIGVGIMAVTAIHAPITKTDWIRFAILVGCVIAHVELTRHVERVRHVTSGVGPVMDTDSAWCIAAVVALPAVLAGGIILIMFAWLWFRLWRGKRPLYRWVFNTATVLVATQTAAAILALDPHTYPGVPTTFAALGLAVVAAALRWLVNFSLVSGAILLSSPNMRAIELLDNIGERIMEVGAFGLGLVAAALLAYDPLLLVGVVVGLAVMHRGVLVAQFRKAARTDSKTGLDTAGWWHQVAEHAFERARVTGASIAALMIDLDYFKRVNDTYGHLAGDKVLQSVAEAINSEIRDCDTAGRWGGEEFVVLIPDVDSIEVRAIAERIRRRVQSLVITLPGQDLIIEDISASIGCALYPAPGITVVDDLVLAADTAVYSAKNNGRNQVVFSSVAGPATPEA
jgi:diguanylate cyclase (GGDEF)-like protein